MPLPKHVLENIKEGTIEIHEEITTKISGYMIAGLSVVAGLAWNDAIKSLIEYLFPLNKNSLIAHFLYAIIISLIVIVASVIITKAAKKASIVKREE